MPEIWSDYLQQNVKCYDCLSTDIATEVIGPGRCEYYFCAACWEQVERDREAFRVLLAKGATQ